MKYKNYDLEELMELLLVQKIRMEKSYSNKWYKIWHQQSREKHSMIAELERREELLTIKN